MKLRYRPMAIMGFSSLSVLFLCAYFDDRFSFVSVGMGAVVLLLTVLFRKLRERVTPFFIAAALILSGVSFEVLSDYKVSYADSLTDRDAVVEATVLDEPEFRRSKYYYELKTDKIDGKSFNVKLSLSASQYIDADPYDKIRLKVHLYEIGSFSSDIKLYYQSKGIFLGGYVSNYDDYPIEIAKPKSAPLGLYFLQFRKTVEKRILDKLPNDYGGVTVGMLTGNKDYISDELLGSIRGAGVAPVFAVSGMHLSVWIMGLYAVLELLGVKKRFNSLIGIFFTLFFMAVTGFSPSVCRAGIMLLMILVGNLFRRKADPINSLGFAALILGIINPMIVADIGFLLSFSSTLGIVVLNPWFMKKLEPYFNGGFFKSIIRIIAESVFVSVSATVASLGFIIIFIGYVSVYSVLSNLLISYAASLCMLCGGVTALLYPLGGSADLFAIITGCLAKYIISVIDTIADFPFATVNTSSEYWIYGVIVFYAIVALAYIVFKSKTAFNVSCVGLCLTVAFCVLLYRSDYAGFTYFKVLNLDESVAVLVSQKGKNALICSQSKNKYLASTVSSALSDVGCDKPDIMIVDSLSGSSSGVLSTVMECPPKKMIVSKCDGSLKSVFPDEKITKTTNAEIRLWENINAEFVSNSNYSIVYCTAQNINICVILRADDVDRIPEKYLEGDVIIASENYDNVNFKDAVKVGESDDTGIVSTEEFGNIDIKIKDDSYKFIIEED